MVLPSSRLHPALHASHKDAVEKDSPAVSCLLFILVLREVSCEGRSYLPVVAYNRAAIEILWIFI
jgi:hypothetical protein